MPGANCAIFGCPISRKHGLAIFKVTSKDDKWSTEWRNKIIDVITRDRVVDESLKEQIAKKNLYVCEKHYPEDKLLRRKYCYLLQLSV